MLSSFLLLLFCFLAIGVYSATRKKSNTDDYLVASRQVNPWLTALSAVSTNNSGFMFIGLIGATYSTGLSSMWLMVGWVGGDYLAWRWVYRRLRQRSEETGTTSIPSFLGSVAAGRASQRMVVVLAAMITLAFLGTYAAAQLLAGSKALHALLGWDYAAGTLLGAAIVAAYCFSGGIRASIWTDAAQSSVMLVSMAVLLVVALTEIGGLTELGSRLTAIDPALIDWRPPDLRFGFALYLIGWIMAGVGVLGQPHVMIRVMAIESADELPQARRIYFTWYVLFASCAILVGLCCRVLLPQDTLVDVELALPQLSQLMLPDVLVGFMLAGLFAATISTADSQILSCSAALTHDLFPRIGESYMGTKVGTLVVTMVTVLIVFAGNNDVFALVIISWSALSAALGPLLVVQSFGKPIHAGTSLLMMAVGLATVIVWRYVFNLHGSIYEVFPGMAAGFLVYWIGSRFK